MSLTACLEMCVDSLCYRLGCNTAVQSNETIVNNNVTALVNNTALNVTQLPCTKQVVVHMEEIPFAISLVILLILCFAFIVYAIGHKGLQIVRRRRNGIFQTSTA